MNTNDFSRCKPGTEVWSTQIGKCEIVECFSVPEYPITVSNGECTRHYTRHGKICETDAHQSLFFSNPNIVAPAKREPLRLECEA